MSSLYDSSSRDQRVTIERAAVTKNRVGQEMPAWSAIRTEWASVRYGTGSERRSAAQEGAAQAATFVFLANALTRSITPADRLNFGGFAWDINSAVTGHGNRGVTVTAVRAG